MDDQIIRAYPVFVAKDNNPQYPCIGERFIPNPVCKIELMQSDVSFGLEDRRDGTILVTKGGQVLSTDDLTATAMIDNGVATVSEDGVNALVGNAPGSIATFDLPSNLNVENVYTPCNMADIYRSKEHQPGIEWFLFG